MVRPSSIRRAHDAARRCLTIGIRREDPGRIWERRAPLTPQAVYDLVRTQGVEVDIEPCERRVFPISDYVQAGARVANNMERAHIILGIKETPLKELCTDPIQKPGSVNPDEKTPRTHLMFSHTTKGQAYNMPLLAQFAASRFKEQAPRLIDYEYLVHEKTGKRSVGFGWFAGVAGVLESLSAMAHSHLEIGIASPFLYTPRPHSLPSLDRLRASLRDVGDMISQQGTPERLGPFVIGLTGTGKVAEGCLSLLEELPTQTIKVQELESVVKNPNTDLRKIYLVHAKPEDYFVGLDLRKYQRENYYKSPQSYQSTFCNNIAPYLTLFLNGTGWSPSYPRLMSNNQLTIALEKAQALGGARFTNIGDISCDVEGGLEFLTKATTLSSPFYKTRPSNLPAHLPSVQMMSVDILPASIPYDASLHFSESLMPYLQSLIRSQLSGEPDSYTKALENSTVVVNGVLAEKHSWLKGEMQKAHVPDLEAREPELISTVKATETPKTPNVSDLQLLGAELTSTMEVPKTSTLFSTVAANILLLGSGMVAGPAVDTLAARPGVRLVIASDSLSEMKALTRDHPNVECRVLDVSDETACRRLIAQSDVVISLLPVNFHAKIAQLCIEHQTHLVTASYISDEMRNLDNAAKNAGVVLLNEIGLDPGIDHCSAVELLERLRSENKEIRSFISFCGGLPAPEVHAGPLGYKFSWRPAGVLAAALNGALYKLDNMTRNVAPEDLLKSYFSDVPVTDEFKLEGLPNRNSVSYAPTYSLDATKIRTLLRGTLRYPGFARLMQSFKSIGLLENEKKIYVNSWSSFIPQVVTSYFSGSEPEGKLLSADDTFKLMIRAMDKSDIGPLRDALESLGLLPRPRWFPPVALPPLPDEPMTPLELFAYVLSQKLRYEPGERDMVVLQHEIIAQAQDNLNAPEEIYRSSLIAYGTPRASAMARTVGIPVATAALAVADGLVSMRGVIGPTDPSVYRPVLQGLEEAGLGMVEEKWTQERVKDTIEYGILAGMKEAEQARERAKVMERKAGKEAVKKSARRL